MGDSQNAREADQPIDGDEESPKHEPTKGSYYYDDSTGYETYVEDSEDDDAADGED